MYVFMCQAVSNYPSPCQGLTYFPGRSGCGKTADVMIDMYDMFQIIGYSPLEIHATMSGFTRNKKSAGKFLCSKLC